MSPGNKQYRIHQWPGDVKILTTPSQPVEEITGEVRDLARAMNELVGFDRDVAGIAGVQLGALLRVIVFALDRATNITMINPVIVKEKGHQLSTREGCLSIPGKFYNLTRPAIVKVTGTDLEGKRVTVKGHDLLARTIRHECDHLDGIMLYQIGKLQI